MIIGFPQHQHGSHNHMLSFSCVSIHHKISYVFRSVSIHDPDPLTMLNLYQKWSKYVWNSQNLYPVRWFVTSTLYQRFYKSITSILSHSEHNLFWNGVHITCRTFPSAILAAGNLLSRCFIRPSILDWNTLFVHTSPPVNLSTSPDFLRKLTPIRRNITCVFMKNESKNVQYIIETVKIHQRYADLWHNFSVHLLQVSSSCFIRPSIGLRYVVCSHIVDC